MRTAILGLSAFLGAAASALAADAPADIVAGAWQRHHIKMNYFGLTSFYSCDGLEAHVRSILLHLGARKDAKVYATGCPRGPEVPSRNSWIDADFFTLEPVDSHYGPDTIRAYWASRELTPQRPSFMGAGDCELVEQMKELISNSFAMREMVYQTECVPHEVSFHGFTVKGRMLLPAPAAAAPAAGVPVKG